MAARMEFKEWAQEAMALVGTEDRGWQKKAAQLLKISEMTIVKAKDRGEAGPKMTRALREAQARAQDWTQLRDEAGKWAVAVPEERAGGDIVCEIIVTRLIEPRFNAFFQFKKDGSVARRADFFDTCDATEMQSYMRAAEERAKERCRTEREAEEHDEKRKELIRATAEATGCDRKDLEKMSSHSLIAMKDKLDDEAREDFNEEVEKMMSRARIELKTDRDEEVFNAGYLLGQLKLSMKTFAHLPRVGGEAADVALFAAGAYFKRRLAHKNSKRRAKEAGK